MTKFAVKEWKVKEKLYRPQPHDGSAAMSSRRSAAGSLFWSPGSGGRGILAVMSDITRLLDAAAAGDPTAAANLLPLVYDELRKLAAARMAVETPGQTLQPTALVHEAYLRLVDPGQRQQWNGRGHFFGAAAEAMRASSSRPPADGPP